MRTILWVSVLLWPGLALANDLSVLTQELRDERTRAAAAHALARLGPRAHSAGPALIAVLTDSEGPVAEALLALGSAAAPLLARTLSEPDQARSAAAAQLLWRLQDQARPALEMLLEQARHRAPERRAQALRVLGVIHERRALAALIVALEDPEVAVKRVAIHGLGAQGLRAAPATERLLSASADLDPSIRQAAVRALGCIGPTRTTVLPRLCELLEDPRPATRQAAAEGLGSMGPLAASAVPALRKLLAAPEFELRRASLLALAAIGPEAQALQVSIEALQERDPSLRLPCAQALARISPSSLCGSHQLLAMLADCKPAQKLEIYETLALIGPRVGSFIPDLLQRAVTEPEVESRLAALNALAQSPVETWRDEKRAAALALVLPTLLDIHRSSEARALIFRLFMSQGERAAPVLIAALPQESGLAAQSLINALTKLDMATVRAALNTNHPDKDVQLALLKARQGLRKTALTKQEEELLQAALDPLHSARCEAVLGLLADWRQLPGSLLSPCLVLLLDADPRLRAAVLETLGAVTPPVVVPDGLLVSLLADPEPKVRRATLQFLRQRPIPGLAERLRPLLSDSRLGVEAAYTLALIGDVDDQRRALSALEQGLISDDLEAVAALAKLGSKAQSSVKALAAPRFDPRWRAACIRALGQIDPNHPALTQGLKDPVAMVRIAALETLAGQSVIIPLLADPQPEVRGVAALALARTANVALTASSQLIAALADEHLAVRRCAVTALAALGPDILPALAPVLADRARGDQASMVIARLHGPGVPEACLALARTLTDPALGVLARGLAAQGVQARGVLAKALQRNEGANFAALALGLMGEAGREPLLKVSLGAQQGLADAASSGLVLQGNAAVTDLLVPLRATDARVRQRAARALGVAAIADRRCTPALIAALEDKESRVRAEAALALGLVAREAEDQALAASALSASLVDVQRRVRLQAARGLAKLGSGALPARARLEQSIKNWDRELRAESATALGALGKVALPALLSALSDSEAEVRQAILTALERLGSDAAEALPALTEIASKDPDERCRFLAQAALRACQNAPDKSPGLK